jgi:hypothetical protein
VKSKGGVTSSSPPRIGTAAAASVSSITTPIRISTIGMMRTASERAASSLAAFDPVAVTWGDGAIGQNAQRLQAVGVETTEVR